MTVDLVPLLVSTGVFVVSCFLPLAAARHTDQAEKDAYFSMDVTLTILSILGATFSIHPHFYGLLIALGVFSAISISYDLLRHPQWDPYGKKAKRAAKIGASEK